MHPPARKLYVAADAAGVARAAARELLRRAGRAIEARGSFHVALSGGSTPRLLYTLLAGSEQADFPRWHVWFGDERYVPPDHADSNFRMARETLLDHADLAPEHVHRIPTETGPPDEVARRYSDTLREAFGIPRGTEPVLDTILLGMGADGHTASLFPGTAALEGRSDDPVVANWIPKLDAHRITLTLPAINAARAAILLVAGADKAPALARVFGEDLDAAADLPAARVAPREGTLFWIVDEAAGARLQL